MFGYMLNRQGFAGVGNSTSRKVLGCLAVSCLVDTRNSFLGDKADYSADHRHLFYSEVNSFNAAVTYLGYKLIYLC
jgi:hypothetical protein